VGREGLWEQEQGPAEGRESPGDKAGRGRPEVARGRGAEPETGRGDLEPGARSRNECRAVQQIFLRGEVLGDTEESGGGKN
jgi:hypothetical protein